jgi:hypothetical protein
MKTFDPRIKTHNIHRLSTPKKTTDPALWLDRVEALDGAPDQGPRSALPGP